MLKIGITQRVDTVEAYQETRDSLDQRWQLFLAELDMLCVPIPNRCSNPEVFCKELAFSGFIFSGGNETDARNRLEETILAYALKNNLPVFGVCKGMQFLTKAFGGELEVIDGHVTKTHSICVFENRFGIKQGSRTVNSYHRFAVKALPADFVAVAKDEKNFCEAMEHKSKSIFACMWHPEREEPFASELISSLKKFFYHEN